jgi:RNA polymerase sigma factor (TIGR02999 family)
LKGRAALRTFKLHYSLYTVHFSFSLSSPDITGILSQAERGDPAAAEQLLPLVYDELRKLAAAKLASEKPGHTLQPTALVHEAYLRLIGPAEGAADSAGQSFNSRGHFFAAAAESMRRILVEAARRKGRQKRGGDLARQPLEVDQLAAPEKEDDLLALDAALDELARQHPRKAELIKLRYFAGLTQAQAAEALGIGVSTADRDWAYARAWLFREISAKDSS